MCVFYINAGATNRFYFSITILQNVGKEKLTSPQFVWLDIWVFFFTSRPISCWATIIFLKVFSIYLFFCTVLFSHLCNLGNWKPLYSYWFDMAVDFNEWCEIIFFKHANVKSSSGTWQMNLFCALFFKNSHKDEFSIVPVLVGALSESKEQEYGKLLSKYLADPSNLFIISSDFCHWGLCPLTHFHFSTVKNS